MFPGKEYVLNESVADAFASRAPLVELTVNLVPFGLCFKVIVGSL